LWLGRLASASAPAAGEGAEVDQEGEDDDEPLEAVDVFREGPHHGVGEGGPGQQEEAQEGQDPAVEGATEQVAEEDEDEQRQPGGEQREE
jgi:hypothetical protein